MLPEPSATILINSFPISNVTKSFIESRLSDYGEIRNIRLARDPFTGMFLGLASVQFVRWEDARQVTRSGAGSGGWNWILDDLNASKYEEALGKILANSREPGLDNSEAIESERKRARKLDDRSFDIHRNRLPPSSGEDDRMMRSREEVKMDDRLYHEPWYRQSRKRDRELDNNENNSFDSRDSYDSRDRGVYPRNRDDGDRRYYGHRDKSSESRDRRDDDGDRRYYEHRDKLSESRDRRDDDDRRYHKSSEKFRLIIQGRSIPRGLEIKRIEDLFARFHPKSLVCCIC